MIREMIDGADSTIGRDLVDTARPAPVSTVLVASSSRRRIITMARSVEPRMSSEAGLAIGPIPSWTRRNLVLIPSIPVKLRVFWVRAVDHEINWRRIFFNPAIRPSDHRRAQAIIGFGCQSEIPWSVDVGSDERRS